MSHINIEGRPIVVGTDGSPKARASVRDAAELAQLDGVPLHIVGCYIQADDHEHRMARVNAPRDVCHDVSGRGDAFADAHEARLMVEGRGIEIVVHVASGTLRHAVATVARQVNGGMVLPERPKRTIFSRFRNGAGDDIPVVALDTRLSA